VSRFDASPYFTVVATLPSIRDVDPGRARHGVDGTGHSSDYHTGIDAGRPVTVQVIADGTDSNSAGVAMGYAANLVGAFNQDLARERLLAAGQDVPPAAIDARIRVWFNPQLESRLFMIPGIVALLLLVITTNLSSMAVVREKELGTLEQLNVTPVTRWQLIVGKLVPYGPLASSTSSW
jgi:ABC-2 type transport system permease protein